MWPPLASFLLINPRSGKGSPTADELAAEARAAGVQTHVVQEGEDPAELARASAAEVFGVAGGDGSLAPVAEVALERDAAFVSIPFAHAGSRSASRSTVRRSSPGWFSSPTTRTPSNCPRWGSASASTSGSCM